MAASEALKAGWLDEFGFERVASARGTGSTYDPEGEGYVWRIVLHTIEGYLNRTMAGAHPSPPQLWASYDKDLLLQTIPLTRAGFALYQGPYAPYYTNRARAIQVELEGFAAEAAGWPEERLDWIVDKVLVPICRAVEAMGGTIALTDSFVPLPGVISGSAYEDAPQRLQPSVWAFGTGLCGHRHVPMGDDHWDAGGLDMRLLRDKLVARLGGLGVGGTVPIDTDRRKGKDSVDFEIRKDKQGNVVQADGAPYGQPQPVVFFDGVANAGEKIVAVAKRPDVGTFNTTIVVGGNLVRRADNGQIDVQPSPWGGMAVHVVKTDAFCTVVLPANVREDSARVYTR